MADPVLMLEGIRVLDLSQYVPGPFATRQLCDLGADVIKIEPPGGDPMRSFMSASSDHNTSAIYQHLNRGKKVVILNLKNDNDRGILDQLIKESDALLQSYRPGVFERLGYNQEKLDKLNPRLILCSLSGYGQTGPYRERAGHDINYVAASGGLSLNGVNEKPVMIYPPLADHAGAMQASLLILAALIARNRDNKGRMIDVSLFESSLSWQYLPLNDSTTERAESLLNGGAACYNIYQTSDEKFVTLGAIEKHFWQRFCEAIGQSQWVDRQFDSMPQRDLIQSVAKILSQKSQHHWEAFFQDIDCCFEIVRDAESLPRHPQIQQRQSLTESQPAYPAWIDQTPVALNLDLIEIPAELIGWDS